MYYGLLALLTRALRMDARQIRNHLFRLLFVAFIYFFLLIVTFQSSTLGAPGLNFFSSIAGLNLLFITCAGIGFFSSAITEEKEEDTIGLLQMAGLNHLGILLGKSTSRMIQVMLLLVVQFPFMLLAVTLGGVTTKQILAAYIDLLAYTVLLANVALVSSVYFHRGGSAAAWTTLMMVLYAVTPLIAQAELRHLTSLGWTKTLWWKDATLTSLEWIQDSCVLYEIQKVMTTGFDQSLWSKQVISNLGLGVVCFGIAWLMFGPRVNRAIPGGATRGMLLSPKTRVRFLSPGRCWSNAFVWKDFQFISGGYPFLIGKLLAYILILVAMTTLSLIPTNWLGLLFEDVAPIYFRVMLFILAIEASVLASRIFHDEIRLQMMSSLLMLPQSIPFMGYSKAIGCLIGLLPAIACAGLGLLVASSYQSRSVLEFIVDPQIWAAVMIVLIFLHLVALLSLFVRWGALPAAIFLMGPISACCPVWQLLLIALAPGPTGLTDVWGKLPATITVWILTGLVCFVFQMMIAARLQELGTK